MYHFTIETIDNYCENRSDCTFKLLLDASIAFDRMDYVSYYIDIKYAHVCQPDNYD